MKRTLPIVAALGVLALCGIPTALAATQGNNPQEVWVAKDVTRAFHYSIDYREYDAQHQLISDQQVTPPTGSLVEYEEVPLSQAQSDGDVYSAVQVGESEDALNQQLESLHQQLYEKLHGQGATMNSSPVFPQASIQSTTVSASAAPSIQTISYQPVSTAGVTYDATGSFTDYAGTTWNYDTTYVGGSTVTVNGYELYEQGSATSHFSHVSWDGTTYYPFSSGTTIPTSYPGLNNQSLYYQHPSGYQWTNVVTEGSTSYSGWVTLS